MSHSDASHIYSIYILYLQRTEPLRSYNEKVQLKKIITFLNINSQRIIRSMFVTLADRKSTKKIRCTEDVTASEQAVKQDVCQTDTDALSATDSKNNLKMN